MPSIEDTSSTATRAGNKNKNGISAPQGSGHFSLIRGPRPQTKSLTSGFSCKTTTTTTTTTTTQLRKQMLKKHALLWFSFEKTRAPGDIPTQQI
jgi:hypothetical protein